MDISAVSNNLFARSVTPSKSSNNRQSPDESNQAASFEAKSKERALEQHASQEHLKHSKQESERRLDGRLISFGNEQGKEASQQKHASFNRSRVNEAYSPPKKDVAYNQNNQHSQASSSEAIDIVV